LRRSSFPIALAVLAISLVVAGGGIAVAAQYPPKAATCASAPSAGNPGTHLVIKGTNWMPNSAVQIQFLQSGSSMGLGSAPTDDKGKFKLTGAEVPNNARRGKAAIEVVGPGISGQTLNCFTNFQVVDSHSTALVVPAQGIAITPGMLLLALAFVVSMVLLRRRWARRFRFVGSKPRA
jgi:hypothetical protein